jgi:uncharacterized protein (DUF488 family)
MRKGASAESLVVLTIGHSTRTVEEFSRLLLENAVSGIVDVRTIPRSKHVPQFNRETLLVQLNSFGISYIHMAGLGGLRHPLQDSPNNGWQNASFRGFADYMQSKEFDESLRELIGLSERGRIALMCAEALPWRCHRYLIADALLVRDVRVEHILGASRLMHHTLTSWAKVSGTRITYPSLDKTL